jgi:NAD+ kinase
VFKSVGLVARYDKKAALKLTDDLAEHLTTKGCHVCVEDTLSDRIHAKVECVPLERMKTDLIITIGGDGTILRTCMSIPKPEPPILAVNMGVRGFLTEVEPKQTIEAVDKCLKGQYRLEKCMKLSAEADGTKFPDALNEVVITHSEPAKLLYTQILKDKQSILTCQADSLILSTQTGSTGYSLSAGGPVLDRSVDAFVLTPICPLTDFRPIVFPADSSIAVQVLKPKEMLVLIDGRYNRIIKSRLPTITISRSEHETSFIRFGENFYHRLKSRLIFRGTG